MTANLPIRRFLLLAGVLITIMSNSIPSADATERDQRVRVLVMPFFEATTNKPSGKWIADLIASRMENYHRTVTVLRAASLESGWTKTDSWGWPNYDPAEAALESQKWWKQRDMRNWKLDSKQEPGVALYPSDDEAPVREPGKINYALKLAREVGADILVLGCFGYHRRSVSVIYVPFIYPEPTVQLQTTFALIDVRSGKELSFNTEIADTCEKGLSLEQDTWNLADSKVSPHRKMTVKSMQRIADNLVCAAEALCHELSRLRMLPRPKSHVVVGKIIKIESPPFSENKIAVVEVGTADGLQLGDMVEIYEPQRGELRSGFTVESCDAHSARGGFLATHTVKLGYKVATQAIVFRGK
jgi:hypothetical protein